MTETVLDLESAKWVLGEISSESLPSVAAQALVDGHDAPALWQLAALTEPDRDEARRLFEQGLAELGLQLPNEREAILRLARAFAIQILHGEVSPYDGGKRIWRLTLLADSVAPELDAFIYAASEWEDRPDDRPLFDVAILEAAKDLITHP